MWVPTELGIATRILAAVGSPLTKHSIKVKGRRDYDLDLDRLLERALGDAISPDLAGTKPVAEAAHVLAKQFAPRSLPGYPKGLIGNWIAWWQDKPMSGMDHSLDLDSAHPAAPSRTCASGRGAR